MISITKMKSDSASTAPGVGTGSDKINLQLHKLIVDQIKTNIIFVKRLIRMAE